MTDINIVDKPNYPYMTLQETILENGHRHGMNAHKYMMDGNMHHAIGSYKKMLRNYERAYLFINLEHWK